eukprot:CAMPEP_0180070404 /NCGR_PEP_ID=MMETSP0985-20121206/11562_1 /TAXON_ID=483367 /ORGANISM="non described non described, Strain CCMP 2436" /LENGTH=172 /DNA_ID=CAMNT_0022001501 /DNA_START=154 /DNA_END=673 /DNA_ORIENTATION=-
MSGPVSSWADDEFIWTLKVNSQLINAGKVQRLVCPASIGQGAEGSLVQIPHLDSASQLHRRHARAVLEEDTRVRCHMGQRDENRTSAGPSGQRLRGRRSRFHEPTPFGWARARRSSAHLDAELRAAPVPALRVVPDLVVRAEADPRRDRAVLLHFLGQDDLHLEALLRRHGT